MPTIAVLEGDETGQELLEEALRVLDPEVTGLDVSFDRYDLSLENRRATENEVVLEAAAAIREHGLGLKAATVTPEGVDDVGSPNRILREEIGGRVIVRTGRRIPGVIPHGGVHAPISVVRMAVGDAYGAKEWREGEGADEVAFRTERIERRICRGVAEFAFQLAERTGAKVFGGPKYTVSPVYEGMLKEEMDAAAERHSDVPYEPQLIDATFALLIATAGDPLVIPSLNRDGDILSDLVLPLFGSIAGAESLLVAFADDDPTQVTAVMAEAAHGTAPALLGKNVANPLAMILAGAAVLGYADGAEQASRAIREASLEAIAEGVRTADLAGSRRDVRVHRRGDPADEVEARGLVDPLAGGGFLPDQHAQARVGPGGRERPDQVGVELRPRAASELLQRLVRSPARAVRTRRRHRVERVRDAEDARLERDVVAAAAGRISVSVPALVVVQDEREDRLGRAERAEHAGAGGRMAAHQAELLLGQRPALEQDRRRDDELADVVQERAEAQHGDPLLVEAEAARHRLREHRDARRMAARVRVASFDRRRECRQASHRTRLFKLGARFPPS